MTSTWATAFTVICSSKNCKKKSERGLFVVFDKGSRLYTMVQRSLGCCTQVGVDQNITE